MPTTVCLNLTSNINMKDYSYISALFILSMFSTLSCSDLSSSLFDGFISYSELINIKVKIVKPVIKSP